ncbi:MAG: hypothetical protein ACK4Y4_07455 [Brevundimonas sp.]
MSGQTTTGSIDGKARTKPEAEPLLYAPGHRSLMRDAGRVITIGAGFGTLFVLLLSAKFAMSAFVILCVGVVGLGAVIWALGTVELRLIEIRDALGGRNRDALLTEAGERRLRATARS